MNKSGRAIGSIIKSKKAAGELVVVHDDIDLPQGTIKISFGRGAAGHHGVESVIRALHTKDFTRIRVGIADVTKKGVKKPEGEKKIIDFLVAEMERGELAATTRIIGTVVDALTTIVTIGRATAMNSHN